MQLLILDEQMNECHHMKLQTLHVDRSTWMHREQ